MSYVKWDESLCLELLYTMFFVGFFLQILNKVVIIIQIEKLMPINLILQDHKNNPCLLIELVFPMDKNLLSGEFGKISKYKDVETEIKRMWHLKPTLIPVIVGAFGTVKKRYKRIFTTNPWKVKSNRNPENCTNKHSTYSEKSVVNLIQ